MARGSVDRAIKNWMRQKASETLTRFVGIAHSEANANPLDGILQEVADSAAMVLAFTDLLGESTPSDPFFFPLLELHAQERDRHVKFAKIAIESDVLERQMRVTEGVAGTLVSLAMSVILDHSMHLSNEQVATFRKLFVSRINEILGAPRMDGVDPKRLQTAASNKLILEHKPPPKPSRRGDDTGT